MANIRVDVNYTIKDGSEIVFRSPVDCSAITGLVVYYVAEDGTASSKEFVLADAHGHNVGDIDHLFAENVVVKVILDVTHGMAFVQNADTNAYIEETFVKSVNGNKPDKNGDVEVACNLLVDSTLSIPGQAADAAETGKVKGVALYASQRAEDAQATADNAKLLAASAEQKAENAGQMAADAERTAGEAKTRADEAYNLASQGGGGITPAASALLISILRNGVYTTQQADNITALEAALASGGGTGEDTTTYAIINSLSNVITDNATTTVEKNAPYTATLTVADGYTMDNITVVMGGVDVTEGVYADGVITIPAVTGIVIITATAVETETDENLDLTWEAGQINNNGIVGGGSHSNIFDVRDATRLIVTTTAYAWTGCAARTFNSIDEEVGAGTGYIAADVNFIDGDPSTDNRGDTAIINVSNASFVCLTLNNYSAAIAESSITVRKEW